MNDALASQTTQNFNLGDYQHAYVYEHFPPLIAPKHHEWTNYNAFWK